MDGLVIGRIVYYCIQEQDLRPDQKHHAGEVVAAMVVSVVQDTGTVNLSVFPDWSNNGFYSYASATPQPLGLVWKTSVQYSESPEPGKWFWPPRK